MTNSADPDQFASSELFAKQGISGISRTSVKIPAFLTAKMTVDDFVLIILFVK